MNTYILILKSILFSILINFSYLLLYASYGSDSDLLLSEHDEYLYLQESLEAGGLDLPHIKILTSPSGHKDPRVDGQPHHAVKKVFGTIAHHLGLDVITFNLLLDIIFAGLSFFMFNLLFRTLFSDSNNTRRSFFNVFDLYTAIFICLPWLLSPVSYIDLTLLTPLENESIVQFFGLYPLYYPCIPVLRSINTQASYPLFGLAVFLFISNRNNKHLAFSGVISGSLIYVYVFPWMLSFILATTYLFINSISRGETTKKTFENILVYISSFIIISLPGLLMIFSSSLKSTYRIPQEVPTYLFFSPVLFILILLSIFLIKKFKTPLLVLFISLLISTLILMNIQPLTQKLLTPYHFLIFYISPFLSVYFAALVLYTLKDNTQLKKFVYIIFISLLIFRAEDEYFKKVGLIEERSSDIELIHYLKDINVSQSYFAIFPFSQTNKHWWSLYPSWRTTPYFLQYKSEKALFPINYEYFSPDEMLYANYFIYHLFRGDAAELNSCNHETIYYPDFAYGIVSFEAIRRRNICKEYKEKIPQLFSKKVLRLPIRFLISEPYSFPELYDYAKDNYEEIWRSSDRKYVVFRIESSNIQAIPTLQ